VFDFLEDGFGGAAAEPPGGGGTCFCIQVCWDSKEHFCMMKVGAGGYEWLIHFPIAMHLRKVR